MANTNNNNTGTPTNQKFDQERGENKDSGNRRPEQGSQFDKNKDKGAIGGGESRSETGEQGRARNELDQDRKEPAGYNPR